MMPSRASITLRAADGHALSAYRATPPHDIATIRRHNPDIEMHTFPADHGFNCDHRKEWHAQSAARALELTLAFFYRNLRAAEHA